MGFPDTVVKRAVKVKSALTPRLKDGKLKNSNISLSWIQPTLKYVVENEKGLQNNNTPSTQASELKFKSSGTEN